MNKIKLIITVLTLVVVAACGSNEGAQNLHDRLVAAGKLEITGTKGFSISSFVNSGSSLVIMDDQASEDFAFEEGAVPEISSEDTAIDADDENAYPSTEGEAESATAVNIMKGLGKEYISNAATVYYVTFKEANFTVEKDAKEVFEGEWQAIDDNTISVDINGGNKELIIELNGNKITLADNVDEYSDPTPSSSSSGNIKKPQIGASGQNNSEYSKLHKKKCYNVWEYTYGYNPANGKYDYHYGPTQQCY